MPETPKILVTGGAGMIGSLLVYKLRVKYGNDNVIAVDIRRETATPVGEPFYLCDITDFDQLERIVVDNKITWLFNESAILAVTCEMNPQLAMKVNLTGFQNVMEIARLHNLRVFSASTMASFGPATTPKQLTPDVAVQRPVSLYGSTKVHNELIGEFYHRKFGVDFRCLRYPTVVSPDGEPRGRVVDFAGEIFAQAVRTGRYTCDVAADTRLSYVMLDDTVDGTIKFMESPNEKLTLRTYNLSSFSCSVEEIAQEIRKYIPGYQIDYKPNLLKQTILDGFPDSLDCSKAKQDWGWQPQFNFETTVREIIARLVKQSNSNMSNLCCYNLFQNNTECLNNNNVQLEQ